MDEKEIKEVTLTMYLLALEAINGLEGREAIRLLEDNDLDLGVCNLLSREQVDGYYDGPPRVGKKKFISWLPSLGTHTMELFYTPRPHRASPPVEGGYTRKGTTNNRGGR